MKEYGLYIFDFDGTLADSYESLIMPYKAALEAVGLTYHERDAARFMHMALVQTAELLGITDMAKFREAFEEEKKKDSNIVKLRIYDDVLPTLEKLKKEGKRIAIVSGNRDDHIKRMLSLKGLSDYFEIIVGKDSVVNPKPYPDLLDYALEKLNFTDKTRAVYIGDSLQDAECANNAGIDSYLLERKNEYPDFKGEKINTLLNLFEEAK